MGFASDKPIILRWTNVPSAHCDLDLAQSRAFKDGWQAFTDVLQGLGSVDGLGVKFAYRRLSTPKVHNIEFIKPPTMEDIERIEAYLRKALAPIPRQVFEFNREDLVVPDSPASIPLHDILSGTDHALNHGQITYRDAYMELREAVLARATVERGA